MIIKNLFEKITGLDKIRAKAIEETAEAIRSSKVAQADLDEANRLKEIAEAEAKKAADAAELAKASPKDRATRKGEPWVSVLDTHVNKDNIRNGFFELDWNEHFVLQLKQAGYGADGDPDEEIVDRWFRDIVYNMFAEAGVDTSRGAGYINVVPINKGRSEVS
jgi:hypothetical protein